jgi:hypothetical protein
MFLLDLANDPAIRIPEDHIDLPDFVLPQYPFDLPPYRRAFFTRVFEAAGVPATCKVAACRRSGRCRGENGLPCYRADRQRLNILLHIVYLACNCFDEEEFARAAAMLEVEFGKEPRGGPDLAHRSDGSSAIRSTRERRSRPG